MDTLSIAVAGFSTITAALLLFTFIWLIDFPNKSIYSVASCVVLRGGSIEVAAHEDESCTVRMITHYEFLSPVVAAARYMVEMTISSMHRIVLEDMASRLCVPSSTMLAQTSTYR
jgi:hypothetical protein